MKHFEITYEIAGHEFIYKCSTIYEATQVLYDLGVQTPEYYCVNQIDLFIQALVELKQGKILAYCNKKISIGYYEGEV